MAADNDSGRTDNPVHPTANPVSREPLFKEERPGGIRVTMPEHTAGPVSEIHEVERQGGSGLGTILTSAVLALLFGGAGAWAYQNYVAPRLNSRQPEASQAAVPVPESSSGQANLTTRVDDLAGRIDQLKSRVEALPKAGPAADIEPLKERVATIDDLSKRVQGIEEKLVDLPKKIDQEGNQITTLTARLEEVSNKMEGLGKESGAANPTPGGPANSNQGGTREALKPVTDTINQLAKSAEDTTAASFGAGAELFKQKKYKDANEFFSTLVKVDQDDARIWYYAALSRGFATGDWKGETERLANRGVEREKAGTPPKAEIDSAFNDLTSETGKDWLAFFRKRAAQQ
jgi:TolA-binding protein